MLNWTCENYLAQRLTKGWTTTSTEEVLGFEDIKLQLKSTHASSQTKRMYSKTVINPYND